MPPRSRTPATRTAPKQAAPESEADGGGYVRNTGPGPLVILADGGACTLAPGRIAALARTPTHRDLAAASEADYRAQLAADETAEHTPEPTPESPADESATEA